MRILSLILFISVLFFSACGAVQKGAATGAATGAVAGGGLGAIMGHQSDSTAEGAAIGAGIGAIGGAIIADKLQTKYCPEGGRRFTSDVEYCPYDGAKLEFISK